MHVWTHTTMMTQDFYPTLDRLPAEILLEVATYLSSRTDVLWLSQVVRSQSCSPVRHPRAGRPF